MIESILDPSRAIRKGYETTVVLTEDGRTVTGLVAEDRADELILHDAAGGGRLIAIAKPEIEERIQQKTSIMPPGLPNQLANRGQFLDLARYVIEIAEQGPTRAAELRPAPSLYAAAALPDYERDIDHAGLIGDWDEESFERGEAIYERLCINCHGTQDRPGSLPTSLRFASGKFKNGNDPYGMYRTLTHGFGMMLPQTWMVPQQKYDVIHYIREEYLKSANPSQYARVDRGYLKGLPAGKGRGPEPRDIRPWATMDYGPNLIASYEVGQDGSNIAQKGIAVRLDTGPGGVSRGRYWMVFDHDTLRMAGAWTGEGFVDWNGIMFNGRHEVHPRLVGDVGAANPTGPGWGRPDKANFDDPRLRGRDGKAYGPLPRDWAHYRGLYHYGDRVIISYTVGETDVLEMPGLEAEQPQPVFSRTFQIGPRQADMLLQVAHVAEEGAQLRAFATSLQRGRQMAVFGADGSQSDKGAIIVAGLSADVPGTDWVDDDNGNLRLRIPAGDEALKFTLWFARAADQSEVEAVAASAGGQKPVADLELLTQGGPRHWPTVVETPAILGNDDRPFAVDVLTRPASNPWLCRVRPTGFDFFADPDSMAVCTWDGDVWLLDGIEGGQGLTWRRIASGLFQPLGLKIVDGDIYVTCRDQIVILRDFNGDGETDFYENFNNDHQVTEHFHEFAMGLQRDDAGNFYYAKSARHALPAVVPHHGTLLRVSPDGSRTDILANGFRAANGVCLNADGSFIVTDQEGHWNPKNRINWVREGGFYGNMYGYHDVTDTADSAMEQPLCWITNAFDRSPAELLWVDSPQWGPLDGSLLNFSYGYGKVFVVPHEELNGQMQGGMCELPIPRLPTGLIRGRFHPDNGQLYSCGMFAWAGSQQQPGGMYRIRYTGKPVHLPVELKAKRMGIEIGFSGELDREQAIDPQNYTIETWSLKRTANYGSEHYDERELKVAEAELLPDGRTVRLEIPAVEPTWCMQIRYRLRGAGSESVDGVIHNTIHNLAD